MSIRRKLEIDLQQQQQQQQQQKQNKTKQKKKTRTSRLKDKHRLEIGSFKWEDITNEICSGVARAFPGGRVAHPESQNEEENEKSVRKSKKKWSKFGKKWGKWSSCPPGTVRLATALEICLIKL